MKRSNLRIIEIEERKVQRGQSQLKDSLYMFNKITGYILNL